MLRQAQKGEISVPDEKIKELKERAKELRKTAVTMIYEAQSGHPGGSLSAADIVAALYFSEMHVDPKDPKWPDRDRFVLSKGHVCPIQYAALGKLGFFPEEDLHTLRQEGSKLQGHPSMLKCPGIDISTGSLGQGTACAVGMALAGKRDGRDYRVFDMVGDGELDEGIIWEAMMTAHKYELDNFIMILDNNGLQLDGPSEVIMPLIDEQEGRGLRLRGLRDRRPRHGPDRGGLRQDTRREERQAQVHKRPHGKGQGRGLHGEQP